MEKEQLNYTFEVENNVDFLMQRYQETHQLSSIMYDHYSYDYSSDNKSLFLPSFDNSYVIDATYEDLRNNWARSVIRFPALEPAIVKLNASTNKLYVTIAANSPEKITLVHEKVKQYWPEAELKNVNEIKMSFWHFGGSNDVATEHSRSLVVPYWGDIRPNYNGNVQRMMDYICSSDFEPGHQGKMILWHGPPGTGKTYAVRALGHAWKKWADVEYIADPEVFFGQSAHYMMKVLMKADRPAYYDEEEENTSKWRLLILEDAGEMLSVDARERSGQGLSRLLNVVDGLLGQGLKVLFLVTTNEPLKRQHPAIARPGRTAVECEFTALDEQRTQEWLEAHDLEPEIKSLTLAQLYAKKHGEMYQKEDKLESSFGFTG